MIYSHLMFVPGGHMFTPAMLLLSPQAHREGYGRPHS